MSPQPATIGIDIGTSGAKGVLLAATGAVLARAAATYPLLTPRPGWTEQEPEAWWQATVTVLQQLSAAAASPCHRRGGALRPDARLGVPRCRG